MIFIFHGDDIQASREAFNAKGDSLENTDILRLDAKESDPIKINLFLNSSGLIPQPKALILTNFFSVPKANIDKILTLLNTTEATILMWQDKNLLVGQLKLFPSAQVSQFKANNVVFSCLNTIKPKNVKPFLSLYQAVIDADLLDLFLYLLKGGLRRQLATYSKFNDILLKRTYLQLIELDYLNKTGQLTSPRDIALQRIILNLIK